MKTAILNVKVDENVKKQAQQVASSIGIPLGTLVNAYLIELARSGQVYFTVDEQITPEMERHIAAAEKEIAAGETVGPFKSTKAAISYLKSV